jgi:hypothetical protein
VDESELDGVISLVGLQERQRGSENSFVEVRNFSHGRWGRLRHDIC